MKTALLIIDMQAHFSEMTHDCLPNILRLNTHFENNSMPRIFTQHGHTKEELTPPFKNQLVKKWGPSGSIAKDSPDWQLMSPVAKAAEGCPIIHKNTYDAFINTNLSQVLEEQSIGRVVVCGVMTDCCCDTTARAAFNRGFETWLVSDACGTASEKQHEAGLRGFAYAFGEVLETDQALARKEIHEG
ncbi:MAG: hypothetical protein LQ350_006789 [Teloschistes chrysophthalmus]|nr:MAG: hypothetical protein LQ350_006789 [Niorma chrysophthalma]